MSPPNITDFLPDFIEAFKEQLESDNKRWGYTWLHRSLAGQEERIENDYNDYFDKFRNAGVPIPWLKVVGNAYIAWIRENNPDLFPK